MVHWTELSRVAGFTIIDNYEDGFTVLNSDACETRSFENESAPFKGGTVSEVNGDVHVAHRRINSPIFRNKAIRLYEEGILAESTERAIESVRAETELGGTGHADLVNLTQLMLVRIAARFIGLDDVDEPERVRQLLRYVTILGPAVEVRWAEHGHDEIIRDGLAAKAGFVKEFYEPSRRRRVRLLDRSPADDSQEQVDLVAVLARQTEWGQDLALREVIVYLTAGIRATSHIVTRTFDELENWLLIHPNERQRAYSPNGLRAACNETLRLHPSSPALLREAVQTIHLKNGPPIEAGTGVAIDLVACNRDETVFGSDAHQFNWNRALPDRVPPYGLSFGAGMHMCPGRPLVSSSNPVDGHRQDLERAVVKILTRLNECGMEVDRDRQPVRAKGLQNRFESYPVRFTNLESVAPPSTTSVPSRGGSS